MTSINNKYNKLWGVWKGKSFPELVTTITFFCRTFPWPAEVLGTFFLFCSLGIFIFYTASSTHGNLRPSSYLLYSTLLKLRTLISEHIIGCRKTKLSMERKMFPLCGPSKYICISVVFRHLRNFPEVFRRFPDISGGFSEISGDFPNEKIKE
jgi:hypothetical protein